MMKKFCHPNLLSCLDSITTHDLKLIITPYCYEGTLMNELKKRGSFDEEKAVFIIKQLVHAIGVTQSRLRNCTRKALYTGILSWRTSTSETATTF